MSRCVATYRIRHAVNEAIRKRKEAKARILRFIMAWKARQGLRIAIEARQLLKNKKKKKKKDDKKDKKGKKSGKDKDKDKKDGKKSDRKNNLDESMMSERGNKKSKKKDRSPNTSRDRITPLSMADDMTS